MAKCPSRPPGAPKSQGLSAAGGRGGGGDAPIGSSSFQPYFKNILIIFIF